MDKNCKGLSHKSETAPFYSGTSWRNNVVYAILNAYILLLRQPVLRIVRF